MRLWAPDDTGRPEGLPDAFERAESLQDLARLAASGTDLWVPGELLLMQAAAATGRRWIVEGLGPRGTATALALGAAGAITHASEAELDDLVVRPDAPLSLVQGPMANVTERPAFARSLQAHRVVPFAALGALDPEQARHVVRNFSAALESDWGAGIIGFDVMPHRDAHLNALRELSHRPSVITVAGGTPQFARRLQDEGWNVWWHAPTPRLVEGALRKGLRGIIVEGSEAGGHVGRHGSAALWEAALGHATAHRNRTGDPVTLVLAGGIGCAFSSAFAHGLAQDARTHGVDVKLQLGSALFFTHELRESGQITPAYQQAALACQSTTLVGASVHLPLRCVPNAFTQEARRQEERWLEQGRPLTERRQQVERFNLGRTRLAAKGIERNPDYPADPHADRYRTADTKRQAREGAFTIGSLATLTDRLRPLSELIAACTHEAVSRLGAAPPVRSDRWGRVAGVAVAPVHRVPVRPARAAERQTDDRIAIVGVGCLLPGANDVTTFWRNLVHGRDSIGRVPDERWSTALYHDPSADSDGDAKSTSAIGAFVEEPSFDAAAFGIPPAAAASLDRSQRLALMAARQAVSGLTFSPASRHRRAVVIGNSMGGEHAKDLSLRVRFREVATDPDSVEADLASRLPPLSADSMAGLLANVIAGRVASWLDWTGASQTVDAACASSLAALACAVDWLRSGRYDAVLTGGVDTDMSIETYVGFCRAMALSSDAPRPFSSRASGFVMGEGAALFVLKRLNDALAAGDPIWATVDGIGQTSDGRGRSITAPHPDGQGRAIGLAWRDADVTPDAIGCIEAHGTATRLGDRTEAKVVTDLFSGVSHVPWMGSVKSSLGHLKGAAGAAGLLKTVLSLRTQTIVPTLRAGPLVAPLAEERNAPKLARWPTPWPGGRPYAGVSAFGFGGANVHTVLAPPPKEAVPPQETTALIDVARPTHVVAKAAAWPADRAAPVVHAFGAATAHALADQIAARKTIAAGDAARQPHRAFFVTEHGAPDECFADAARQLSDARDGSPSTVEGLVTGSGPPAPIALLFPGQGSQQRGAIASLRRLPDGARALTELQRSLDSLGGAAPSFEAMEGTADEVSSQPVDLHATLFALGVGWTRVLTDAGIPIVATLGHSLGAFAALHAAWGWRPSAGLQVVLERGRALEACPPGAMLALRVPVEQARETANSFDLEMAADNAPAHVVLAGQASDVERAAAALGPSRARRLRVARAYHTSAVEPAVAAIRRAFQRHPPPEAGSIEAWSATTARRVTDPAEDLARGVRAPVRFREALQAVADGRSPTFVEVGPGRTLTRFAHALGLDAVALDPAPTHDENGIVHAAAFLAARGHPQWLCSLPTNVAERATPGATASTPRLASPPAAVAQSVAPQTTGETVRDTVTAAVSEVTGYAAHTLTSDADLEGRYGIDSVRKMEILGLLEQRLNFTASDADFAALSGATLDTLVAYASARQAPVETQTSTHNAPSGNVQFSVPRSPQRAANERHIARSYRALQMHLTPPTDQRKALPGNDSVVRAFRRSVARESGRTPKVDATRPWTPMREHPLPKKLRVLATGGVTGIVAKCLLGLADLSPVVTVFGRRGPDDDAVAAALRQLVDAGLRIQLVSVDLADHSAVNRAVAAAQQHMGGIDLVVHGAGMLRDAPAARLTPADLDAVWQPKVLGAQHLKAALKAAKPALSVSFSSVVPHLGNPGQSLYGAANAALERIRLSPRRHVNIAWTAWSDVGMAAAPALQRLLRRRGIEPIDPAAGALAFRQVCESDVDGTVWVTKNRPPGQTPFAWPVRAIASRNAKRRHFSLELRPEDAALADHKLGGRPLVPGATWAHTMMHMAARDTPNDHARSLRDFHIHAPTFVTHRRTDVVLEIARTGPHKHMSIRNRDGLLLASATLQTGTIPNPPSPCPAAPQAELPAHTLYNDGSLFHGPQWRVLKSFAWTGPTSAQATIDLPAPRSMCDGSIDAAHQLMSMWALQTVGWRALPVGADEWIDASNGERTARMFVEGLQADGKHITANVRVQALSGAPLLCATRVALRAADA